MGQEEDRPGNWSGLVGYILGHKKILKNPGVGFAHLLLFWGFGIPLLLVILAQFAFVIPRAPALFLSLLTDVLGIAMLTGIFCLLIRRMRSTGPVQPTRVIHPMIILMIILITGFLAEGTRLNIVHQNPVWSSPVGWLFSFGLPDSPLFMQIMIRLHFLAVLLLIAMLPFTFMRHLVAGALNVYYRKIGSRGSLKKVAMEQGVTGAKSINDLSWKQLLDAEACVSCGRCDENCPALISGKPLSPRKVMRNILEQMEEANRIGPKTANPPGPLLEDDITPDEIWACTTCLACAEQCPLYIEPMVKIVDMRRYRVMGTGMLPDEARPMLRNLEIYGDVQGKGIAHRLDWAFNRQVPSVYDEGVKAEILLWIGCSGAFHPRYQDVARAMVEILKAGHVEFATMGRQELCCGDPARRMGEETLFLDLAKKNTRRLRQYNFKKIVALCPHCFNTLKHEYPSLGSTFEVLPAVEFVMDLIREKRINPKYPLAKKVALHDPCYLGRANHIYEPLRDVTRAVPGTQLVELRRNREQSFCCGGGGGRMWLHERLGQKINQTRSEEIVASTAGVVGTACPYCRTMLEDGIGSLELEKPPKVLDIIELVASSLG